MPNTTSGYNGNTDFLKWYKGLYGTDYDENTGLKRKEGMSDGDWDVGTILHNYYIRNQQNENDRSENADRINQNYDTQINTAKAGYDSARGTLAQNKNTAQQNASIVYDKLKRYLPKKAAAQGLGGLGTESSGLEAYSKYMSQMGTIDSDYQSGMRTIDENETSHIGELEKYRAQSLEENDILYDGLARSYGDTADADARSAMDRYLQAEETRRGETFDLVQGALSSSASSDANQLLNYLKGYQDKVSPEQYGVLSAYAESIAAGNAQKESDKQTSEYNNNYNMAISVLSSSASGDVNELLAYVNGLEGKVSTEQLAALRQMAQNVAEANARTENSADRSNAAEIVETVVSGMIDTGDYEGAKEYLDNNKDVLGTETTDAYNKVIESGNKATETAKTEEEQAAKDERIISGKEFVSYGGEDYRILEKLDSEANEIRNNDSFAKQLKEHGFSDPYDPDIPNGTTFYINRDWLGNDKNNIWDYIPFIQFANISAYGTGWHVTYYNGEWYHSEIQGTASDTNDSRRQATANNANALLNYLK